MSDEKTEFRLGQLESAVENIGDAMHVFTEFMLTAKIWARVAAVLVVLIFGIIQPIAIAIAINKIGA